MNETNLVVAGALLLAGLGMYLAGLLAARLLGVRVQTAEKLTTYESGVDPEGSGWAQVHSRYYLYAFAYVIFAVDAVYLFPWATVLQALGVPSLVEMAIFLGVLAFGLVFAVGRGLVNWR